MEQHSHRGGRGAGRWVFWGFAAVAAYFLFTEHRAHLVSSLPYLLLAACPLMHLLHHGGHGHGHGRHRRHGAEAADEQARGAATGTTPPPAHRDD